MISAFAVESTWSWEAGEYEVKAAFIFNFIKFAQWPETAFSDGKDPYHICVMGDDSLTGQFQAIDGQRKGNRKIKVDSLKGEAVPHNCHILFFDRNTDASICKKIMADLGGKPILMIGETQEFIQWGGAISFFSKNNRLHFKISPKAAMAAGVMLSSHLLNLSVIEDKGKSRR